MQLGKLDLDPLGTTPFRYPAEREDYVKLALSGMRYEVLIPEGFEPRRVLDLGAAEGAFACWVARRWPRAWIDMVEPDEELRTLAEGNTPPGAIVLASPAVEVREYDLVRIGSWSLCPWREHPNTAVWIADFTIVGPEVVRAKPKPVAQPKSAPAMTLEAMADLLERKGPRA